MGGSALLRSSGSMKAREIRQLRFFGDVGTDLTWGGSQKYSAGFSAVKADNVNLCSACKRHGETKLLVLVHAQALIIHNRRKRLRIERRPAHQRAIDFLLRHQRRGIVRLHRSSVENALLRRELFPEHF